jgi:peptidoglycan-N-acetylglucosamine deacetylase
MGLQATAKNLLLAALMNDRFVAHRSRQSRVLALTFDDGPDPLHTPMVLDILRAENVCATFFLIGERVERHPEIVRRIVAEGHQIGNHAYRHVKFAALPLQNQLGEIDRTDWLLSRSDGQQWHWFRPPQGRLPLRLLFALMRNRQRVAMWSYDSLDYKNPDVASVLSRFDSSPVRDGDVILFHDDNEGTARALQQLLPQWRQQGYGFSLLAPLAEPG